MGSNNQYKTKMGEGTKQVRVDNWGIFFLQRLQMFFNKTDYCDLTLQFEGNVQLKVHRLVMNACTEYFHVLEQTCEVVNDAIIMPPDLQADVVLPIVNFMYTGMLEFHTSIFDQLYKTADLMNITVLTKILDAQKIPIVPLTKSLNKRNSHFSHTWNLQAKKIVPKTTDTDFPAPLPGRKIPVWKRRSMPTTLSHTAVSHYYQEQKKPAQADPLACFDNTPKPTRFEWPEDDLSSLNFFDSTFNDISYTSKPLLIQEEEPRPSTSFDRIKETPNSCRRSTSYNDSSVDMDDVKDYVKEQRIRSNMTEDDDEDDDIIDDYENIGDKTESSQESLKRKSKLEQSPTKRVRFSINEKENQNRTTKINITPTGKISPDLDHTKIISEVLKKYPKLVKKNKNIRLKILAKRNNSPPAEETKKVTFKKMVPKLIYENSNISLINKMAKVVTNEEKKEEEGPWKCLRCSTPGDPVEFVLYYLFRKHMTDVHNEKFDSCMCKFCGHKSSKPNMLMYHQYTKHGIKPPINVNFPKCNKCPYIALSESLLIKHKMNHTKYELQCADCKVTFVNQQALTLHMQITNHTGKSGRCSYDCQYCTKKFQAGATLFSHIRQLHRDEARRDGIVSIDEVECSDDEEMEKEDAAEQDFTSVERKKIKILSDVKLPSMELQQNSSDSLNHENLSLVPSSEAEALNNVASGIATSLGLVDVVVLDENQQYILHTDNQQGISSGDSEFILPDLQDSRAFTTNQQVISSEQNVITQSMLHSSDIGSTDELVMVLTDHDYGDENTEIINNENSNIVVLYSHPIDGPENQYITSQGNLMLTSQSGLIELRNSDAIVSSTNSAFITSSSERSESSHIESIEMIQREINQHPDIKNQLQLVQGVKSTIVHDIHDAPTQMQPLTEQIEMLDDSEQISVLQQVDENDQLNTMQDVEVSDNDSHQVEQDVVNKEPEVSAGQSLADSDLSETTNQVSEEQASTEIDQPSTEEFEQNTEEATDIMKSPCSDDKLASEDPNENAETVTESIDENTYKSRESPTIEQKEEFEPDVTTSEDIEMPMSEPTPEPVIEETEAVPLAAEETQKISDCQEISELNSNSMDDDLEKETATSQEDENSESQDENSQDESFNKVNKGSNYIHTGSEQSAKIILDDWEDTDSQQSDSKNGNNVNKLIHDWDDDEEDIKKE